MARKAKCKTRIDGDSSTMSVDQDGNGRAVVSLSVIGMQRWSGYLKSVRAVQGQHGVRVTPFAAEVVWRNPGDYAGRHRRHSNDRMLQPREWECVLLTHHEGRMPLWWRTGDLHHLPPFPGNHRHVNDGAPWNAPQPDEHTITTSRQEPHQ